MRGSPAFTPSAAADPVPASPHLACKGLEQDLDELGERAWDGWEGCELAARGVRGRERDRGTPRVPAQPSALLHFVSPRARRGARAGRPTSPLCRA